MILVVIAALNVHTTAAVGIRSINVSFRSFAMRQRNLLLCASPFSPVSPLNNRVHE